MLIVPITFIRLVFSPRKEIPTSIQNLDKYKVNRKIKKLRSNLLFGVQQLVLSVHHFLLDLCVQEVFPRNTMKQH